MSLSPVPFLRIGFAILGFALALAVWIGDSGLESWWQLAGGGVALGLSIVLGEAVVRQVCARGCARGAGCPD